MPRNKIIINTKNIVYGKIGKSEKFKFENFVNYMDEIKFLSPIKGEVEFTNVGENIIAEIRFKTQVKMDCARCLNKFKIPLLINFRENFKFCPDPDEFGIQKDGSIDIWPPIRQEILLNIPLKPLCNKDCKMNL